MNRIILATALLGSISFGFTQETSKSDRPERPPMEKKDKSKFHQEKLERMKTDLNLSDSQVKKIKALHEKEEKAREQEREAIIQKKKAKRAAHQKAMKSILTAEQYQKWEENMKKGKPEPKHKPQDKK